jgi:hypothetical protein
LDKRLLEVGRESEQTKIRLANEERKLEITARAFAEKENNLKEMLDTERSDKKEWITRFEKE